MPMTRAVLLDLFGTLVPCYPLAALQAVLSEMASDLGLPFDVFRAEWMRTFPLRRTGAFKSLEENLDHVLDSLGHGCTRRSLIAAAERRRAFEARTLLPHPGTLETLAALRSGGVRLALVSNCSLETAEVWPSSPLSDQLDHVALSCLVRAEKPDAAIYLSATSALAVEPPECLFVGDGGSDELLGAQRLGIAPVLIRTADDDGSTPERVDRAAWKGPFISEISEILRLVKLQA
jgi:putative hydrolase of the HAD superfamily